MRFDVRARQAVVAVACCSLVAQGPVTLAARPGQAAPKPAPSAAQQPAAPSPAAPKPAAPKPAAQPAAAAAPAPPDGGWPRIYDLASGGSMLVYQPQVATWQNQTKHGGVQRRLAPHQGRRQARRRHHQVRSRYEGRSPRTAGELPGHEDRGGELPDAVQRADPAKCRPDRQGHPAGRSRDRARPRAGQHRQERHGPEERRGRQGRSARPSSSARPRR